MFIPLKDENPTYSFSYVTVGLIVTNGLVFFHQITLDIVEAHNFVFQWGAIPYQIIHGEVLHGLPSLPPSLTLLSSMFLHGGFFHIVGNMLYLWIFGNNIEDVLGHFRFFFYYLICGVVAGIAQVFSSPESTIPMIGASGAVAGVLGGYLLLFPHARVVTLIFFIFIIRLVRLPALIVLGFWFFVQLLGVGAGAVSNVAFFAHIGGFIAGLIVVKIFQPKWSRRRRY